MEVLLSPGVWASQILAEGSFLYLPRSLVNGTLNLYRPLGAQHAATTATLSLPEWRMGQ